MALREDLQGLARKYEVLLRLRTRREARTAEGHEAFDDAESRERGREFGAIAGEFPGALRELDGNPARLLAAKLRAVNDELAHAGDAPRRQWVAVVIDFHRTLRTLLAAKRWLAEAGLLGGAALDDGHVARCGLALDLALLRRVQRPPGGRLLALAWSELLTRHAMTRDELEDCVFGTPPGGIEG